jgi:anti-sigma B factor antagonist
MQSQPEMVDDVAVFTLDLEHLDAGNAKQFRQDIGPEIEPHAKVVFDMSGVQFVDSSGCGALLSCLREQTARGGDLKLCGISKPVRALFELVRMHKIFDILPDKGQAVAAYRR